MSGLHMIGKVLATASALEPRRVIGFAPFLSSSVPHNVALGQQMHLARELFRLGS